MNRIRIIVLITIILATISCEKIENNLCKEETKYRIYELEVYTDVEDGIRCAAKKNKPIFVLFTGFGCVGDTSYESELFEERIER